MCIRDRPNILGMSEPLENAADMVTRGWELALTWNDQLDNGLHYSVGFNLSDKMCIRDRMGPA